MKIKTSLSLEQSTIERARKVAEREDRSLSYVLEKIIEGVLNTAEDTDSFADAVKKLAEDLKARGKGKIQAAREKK